MTILFNLYYFLVGILYFCKKIIIFCWSLPLRPCLYLRLNGSDIHIFIQIFINCEYRIPCQLETVNVIFDIGANIGLASRFFNYSYPDATIYALEPEMENFNCLKKNVQNILNINIFQYAVWSSDIYLKILNKQDALSCGYQFIENKDNEFNFWKIPGYCIPSLMEKFWVSCIDILKIDIEWAEKILFEDQNSFTWLSKTRLLIIESHDRFMPWSSKAIFQSLRDIDYEFFVKGENMFFLNKKFQA